MKLRLLIVTQTVDRDDPVLGFFHEWIAGLAERSERVTVIALSKGDYALPANVSVYSLGKEEGVRSRVAYALRFIRLAWETARGYDAVLVHMNQEYILVAGWLWVLLGKRIYLWRNHYAGSFATRIAVAFCTKVFCTSSHSYTARFKRTVLMPVGIDTARFLPDARIERVPYSVLFFARMAPSKRPHIVIEALAILAKKGVAFTASFVGSPIPKDHEYYRSLKRSVDSLGLSNRIHFRPALPNKDAPDIFRAHEIFVNASRSGMFDKTLFEAAAAGALVLASSDDWKRMAGDGFHFADGDAADLARKLEHLLSLENDELQALSAPLQKLAESQSLYALIGRLIEEMA